MDLKTAPSNVLLLLALLLTQTCVAQGQPLDDWHASKSEAAVLPQFCWGQMMGNVNGMEYWIPRETCGEGMNHYCLGQLSIVRANRTFGGANLYKKKALLRAAKDHTEYTLTAMRDYPSCPIREHAETTLKQIESQLRAFRK